MLDAPPALYSEEAVAIWCDGASAREARTVPDTNHYSILLAAAGAAAVAAAVAQAVGAPAVPTGPADPEILRGGDPLSVRRSSC